LPRHGRRRWVWPPQAARSRSCCRSKPGSPAALELVTEQDILGDRLVRRKKKRKDADAFLAELSALTPGDLVVHMDHGIGRYEGLEATTVGKSPHDCVQLTYAGGDKLYPGRKPRRALALWRRE
jgi:transcription-repair coupling factor (superfamily II helicase)